MASLFEWPRNRGSRSNNSFLQRQPSISLSNQSNSTVLSDVPIAESSTSPLGDQWSERFETRYQCVVPSDLKRWLDEELFRHVSAKESALEYCHPVDIDVLLSDAPEVIWPALMPCDLLPILGNDAGDWLCLRLGADNQITEVIQWYHGGGDWIPWGRSLSEAILFDSLQESLPGPNRRHAIAAEVSCRGGLEHDPLVAWALSNLPSSLAKVTDERDPDSVSRMLLQHHISEVAVRCQLVIDALHDSAVDRLATISPEELGAGDEVVAMWRLDSATIPSAVHERLSTNDDSSSQDWDAVFTHCQRVCEIAPHLAWGWDLLGYCHQREGQESEAIACYRRGLECSIFTEQSVRLQTFHQSVDGLKFSASRLCSLADQPHGDKYLELLCCQPSDERRRVLTDYWIEQADRAAAASDFDLATDLAIKAGWDLGAEPMPLFGDLLTKIQSYARKAGRAAQAAIVQTHRDCFRNRYGV